MSKLNPDLVEELGLMNDSTIQSIIVKLDADKPRELRFRQFLDYHRKDGIDMKETILQLFERLAGEPTIKPIDFTSSVSEIRTTEQKKEVDASDFDAI